MLAPASAGSCSHAPMAEAIPLSAFWRGTDGHSIERRAAATSSGCVAHAYPSATRRLHSSTYDRRPSRKSSAPPRRLSPTGTCGIRQLRPAEDDLRAMFTGWNPPDWLGRDTQKREPMSRRSLPRCAIDSGLAVGNWRN